MSVLVKTRKRKLIEMLHMRISISFACAMKYQRIDVAFSLSIIESQIGYSIETRTKVTVEVYSLASSAKRYSRDFTQ